MKAWLQRLLAGLAIVVIVAAPFLLLVDFERFVPVVLTIWLLSAVYFIFIKSRR